MSRFALLKYQADVVKYGSAAEVGKFLAETIVKGV
jgi:hypothetical protein